MPRRAFVTIAMALLCASCAPWLSPHAGKERLPAELSDAEFWRLISDVSEPGGSFPSDNFVSNEERFQEVIPALAQPATIGGAYLGVGPEQNFTYIVALEPQVAFILDIRRQNLWLHLLYKALIELSHDRAELLSRLFSRPRPPGLGSQSSPQALVEAYEQGAPSAALYRTNLHAIVDRLVRHHHFALTPEDVAGIEYEYSAFRRDGPGLHYSIPEEPTWLFPTYGALLQATDAQGEPRGYLATEANFQALKKFEERNLIVPVVGDFAGDRSLRAVGEYLRRHGLVVRAFYVSNVEMYLFDDRGSWKTFYRNLAGLPSDANSTLIRSYNVAGEPPDISVGLATVLDSVEDVLRAVGDGEIQTYTDVTERSK
jgi:hypothetical protein